MYPKQGDTARILLKRIGDYIDMHGYPPSVRDLEGGPGLKGRSQVVYHRNRLEKMGLLTFTAGITRSILLTKKGRQEWTRILGASQ